jgi:hypothetical protein
MANSAPECKNCIHAQQHLDLSASIIHRHLLNNVSEESKKEYNLGEHLLIYIYMCHLNAPVQVHSNDWCSHWTESTQINKENLQ